MTELYLYSCNDEFDYNQRYGKIEIQNCEVGNIKRFEALTDHLILRNVSGYPYDYRPCENPAATLEIYVPYTHLLNGIFKNRQNIIISMDCFKDDGTDNLALYLTDFSCFRKVTLKIDPHEYNTYMVKNTVMILTQYANEIYVIGFNNKELSEININYHYGVLESNIPSIRKSIQQQRSTLLNQWLPQVLINIINEY